MKCFVVSHTHWDREWYRTFQQFRARLVDTVDRILDLLEEDPGFSFMLDGQTIVLEDYLEIRPQRRSDLQRACRSGRLSIGPWYVQPDSLLPSGEAHIRNLQEGRRVGAEFGPVSHVAYTPDSFGHPAQFPQIFAGLGLGPFIYWRGNGDEITGLPSEYRWEAPDGSVVAVHHLGEGYFNASGLPVQPQAAADYLEQMGQTLVARSRNGAVLFMNGVDHAFPDPHTAEVVEILRQRTGWDVRRTLLEDFVRVWSADAPLFRGELVGGRIANLLSGVWSTHVDLKLRNRRCETALEGWAEPWAALLRIAGGPDERPSLRLAWRSLLPNQAHDSICGCSQDRVHAQMHGRYDTAEELATQTTQRALERIAGLGLERRTPWQEEIEVAVFNPSPLTRTDRVRLPIDPSVWFEMGGETSRGFRVHPLLSAAAWAAGFTANGDPVRVLEEPLDACVWLSDQHPPRTLEFVARDVPPMGWSKVRVRTTGVPATDLTDEGASIATAEVEVSVAADGTFDVGFGGKRFTGLCAVEDCGDRGDTYDFDPVPGEITLVSVRTRRWQHPSGMQGLVSERILRVPCGLTGDRENRAAECVDVRLEIEARLVPGVMRVDLVVRVENRARDHRLRLLFPTGAPAAICRAATTFDVTDRPTTMPPGKDWAQPPQPTFPHQGFVSANDLTVVAPGLPEAEVTPGGVMAITLLRCVGWLARLDLKTRPQPAGPQLTTEAAQALGVTEARLFLLPNCDARAARDAELGLWAVMAGDRPMLPPDQGMVELAPNTLMLSAMHPAVEHDGIVLRVLNPSESAVEALVTFGFSVQGVTSVRFDEKPDGGAVIFEDNTARFPVGAHQLRTLLLS